MSYVEHIYDMLFELPLSRKQEVSWNLRVHKRMLIHTMQSEADYMGLSKKDNTCKDWR